MKNLKRDTRVFSESGCEEEEEENAEAREGRDCEVTAELLVLLRLVDSSRLTQSETELKKAMLATMFAECVCLVALLHPQLSNSLGYTLKKKVNDKNQTYT